MDQVVPECHKCHRKWEKTVPLVVFGHVYLCGLCYGDIQNKLNEEKKARIEELCRTS